MLDSGITETSHGGHSVATGVGRRYHGRLFRVLAGVGPYCFAEMAESLDVLLAFSARAKLVHTDNLLSKMTFIFWKALRIL
jgi:hypothetical protein